MAYRGAGFGYGHPGFGVGHPGFGTGHPGFGAGYGAASGHPGFAGAGYGPPGFAGAGYGGYGDFAPGYGHPDFHGHHHQHAESTEIREKSFEPDAVASCLCGAVEVGVKGLPDYVVCCHCSQCRRALTGYYSTQCGYHPENFTNLKGKENLTGFATGGETRYSCKTCCATVYNHYTLDDGEHNSIFNNMFTTPKHGPDGKIGKEYAPKFHIFYTSGTMNVIDGLPKFAGMPSKEFAAWGTDDAELVPEVYHK